MQLLWTCDKSENENDLAIVINANISPGKGKASAKNEAYKMTTEMKYFNSKY